MHVVIVWRYLRCPLSLRDVEEMLSERGGVVTYGRVRCWATKFALRVPAAEA
ncbi:MAG: hypothetical protein AVDCRST_MAG68-1338 [uncultured Gemmatimonadetes bacterium]|uniref:Transposase n=1 Tax=uncultured Gemmatimonadota bacterium TaxID=203437 RepID=A0A6J4KQP3_9BACT|nr:MAG: hypothetical protein AVDCRST_MAG68-1338 [uncultured Gemmatimonadota bacterium]